MKFPEVPLFSRRALLFAASVSVAAFAAAPAVEAGTIRHDYALTLYKDFATNSGMFAAGATNVQYYHTDGSAGGTIAVMPNLSGFLYYHGRAGGYSSAAGITASGGNGGAGLIAPQYFASAFHVGIPTAGATITFFPGTGNAINSYSGAGYDEHGYDQILVRLDKIVTETTYNPLATDSAFIRSLSSGNVDVYRLGTGQPFVAGENGGLTLLHQDGIPIGGVARITHVNENFKWTGNNRIVMRLNKGDSNILGTAMEGGDSGSPLYAYNAATRRFEYVGTASTAASQVGYFGNYGNFEYNPSAYLQSMAAFDSDHVSVADAGEVISWNGTNLSRGDETWDYHGLTNGCTTNEQTRGIVLDNAGTGTQEIRLAQAIDLGAGSVTVNSGSFLLSSDVAGTTSFKSAGFIVNAGATLTTTFSGAAGTEWRKVGEGNLVVQGSGNHEIALNVGGGVQQFDENLNLLYLGEVRLDREGGYAAKTIRLSAGVAKIVLMRDGQINGASSFTFGIGGGLLNLNGQNLSWNVVNHTDSGAEFGNFKLDDATEAPADSTFTYTGSGTFKGGFIDGNGELSSYDSETQSWNRGGGNGNLKVVYAAANSASSWTLTGTSKNAGGFEVNSGTLVLQGANTAHANATYSDSGDWTYAILETPGGVTVNNGATFRLSHHALMTAEVTVNNGVFEMTDTVKAASESISGGLREDVTGIRSLRGNVSLTSADATMKVNTTTKTVALHYDGAISGAGNFEKLGSGKLVLGGANTFSGTKTVTAGTLEFSSFDAMGDTTTEKWNIGADGALTVVGEGAAVLDKISGDSAGVLALDADVTGTLDLSGHRNLFIGAAAGKTINYGAANLALATNSAGEWRLGGGGGTLNVLYKLTGKGTLIVGNEVSSGTVYLANENNDFSGKIVIGGFNNFLDYVNLSALGDATFAVEYGNAMGIGDGGSAKMMNALDTASAGIAALSENSSATIDFSNKKLALGAVKGETVRYAGTLTPNADGYRFGGSGTLILDTQLSGSAAMTIDAQGMSGGRIIFAQENSGFTGAVTAGAKLDASSSVSDSGSIVVGFENSKALANASSFTLNKGAVLDVGGADVELRNVTVNSGSAIKNLGTERRTFTITYDGNTSWLNGTFGSGSTAAIDFVKKGAGTLTLGNNNAFVGTMTIAEGIVNARSYSRTESSFGSSGSGNGIIIEKGATVNLTLWGVFQKKNTTTSSENYTFRNTALHQTVTGAGTLIVGVNYRTEATSFSSTNSSKMVMVLSQNEQFEGTLRLKSGGRLLVGQNLGGMSNAVALDKATIEVESGAQVRVTNRLGNNSANPVFQESYANYVISGSGFNSYNKVSNFGNLSYISYEADYEKTAGALSVDCGSIVYGDVKLAANATIASHSAVATTPVAHYPMPGYGAGNYYGGTIRGAILGGADKTLTLGGNESLTFQADAASNYGDLVIANGNGSLSDKFALRVNGGAYRSTISTALGGGTVTLNAGLILRFGNTEKAGNDVVYTYENAFSLGDGSKLESNWNTTRLTGAVTLAGTSATLATRNGSALRLEGGLVGDSAKTANVAAGSLVALGGNAANAFAGTLATGAGTALTLLDSAAEGGIASTARIAFTDSLTLSLEGARQFTLASIVGTADAAESTALDLHYDFTSGTGGSSLSAGTLTSDALNVFIDLNSTETLTSGSYTLLSGGAADGLAKENCTLATQNDRLALKLENGALVLTVDADGRLVWRRQDGNAAWDTTTVHWNSEKAGNVAFAAGDSVIFDATGVAADNSAANRESVTLAAETTVGSVLVSGAFYTFSGAGKLSGENASLNVAANGSLRLETSGNAFAQGATVQDGGTLALAADGALTDTALSLKNTGTLALEASGALAGTTTVVFDGGTLRYGAGAGDVSAFLRAGTDSVKLDLNGNAGVALANLSALSSAKTATIALSNSAYDADAGTGAASATLGAAGSAYETAAGSALEIGAGVAATHVGKGTLGTLSGAGDYTFDGSAGALTIADMTGFTGTAAIVNNTNNLTVTNKSAGTKWRLAGTLVGGINFNDFAAADATLSFEGLNLSWVPHSKTFAQNLVLTNGADGYGVMFSDGSGDKTTTYTGTVTGDGLFLVTRSSDKATTNDKIKFTGDLSGFAGGFESRAEAGGAIAFGYVFSDDGGATIYADNARALGTGGITLAGTAELNFAADHGVANAFSGTGAVTKTGAGALSLSGDWSRYAGTLTVGKDAGGLTLSGADQHLAGTYAVADALRVTGTATFDAGATVSFGSLSVAQGGSLSMSGGVTLAARAGEEAATLGAGATLSHSAIVGATTDDASSELANASATFSGTREGGFALTNVALENTEVVAQNSAALTLTDVALRDNSRLTVKDTASATLAGAFASLGEISVESGGTLTIAGTANLFTIGTSEALPVLATTAGSVVFGDGMFLRLQSEDGSPDFGESGVTVQLFKVLEGATFSGDISAEKISWNGAALGERTTFSFDQNAGTLSFSGSSAYNLTWNGGAEGTWNKTDETAFTIDGTEGTPTRFYDRDAVTFATADARVTLGAVIDASAVAVQENLTLSADATNTFHADSIVIDAGKTLTLEGAATAEKAGAYSWEALTLADASSVLDLGAVGGENAKHVAPGNVFGTGTVKVSFNSGKEAYKSTLRLGSGFAGTAYVTAGNVDVSASDIGGGSYRLADGVNVQAAGNSTTVFAGAFTFEGTTDFHTNGGSTFTVNGGLFGSRLDKNGSGTLVVAGETRLDAFTAEAGGGTTNFDGKTSITTVGIANGTTNFNAATSISAADIKNGTTNFNAATTLGTVSLSAGTLNFGANSVAEIETLAQTGGTLTIAGTANVGALALSNSVTLSLTNSAQDKAVSLGVVSLADGATGTLKVMNNSKNLSLASLSGAAGTKLVLDGNASTMRITNVILGDGTAAAQTGAFAGTLEAKVTAGNASTRKLAVILNGADLSATTVTFGANSGAAGSGANVKQLGLGLKVDSVIAGLNSDAGMGMGTKVFALNAASTPSNGTENFASGTEARALEIRTAANATHTFCGEVLSNVNVKVTGAGTQIFKGGFAAGSSLTLDSGTATFAATAAGAFAGNLTINGGTFNVSNAGGVNAETLLSTGTSEITINGGALNFVSSRWTIQSGIKLTLAGGSVTGTGIGDGSGTLDFYQSTTVDVRAKAGATAENPTVSTISSPVRYRNYSTTTYDVEAGAKLVHSGEIMKGNYAGIITKTGAGEMLISGSIVNETTIDLDEGVTTISGAVNGGTINVNGGTATLSSGTFNASLKVASGAELRAGAAVSLTTAAQTLKLYVSDAQKGESGAALVTSADGGRVTVSGDAKVYVDISALTLAASAENSESVTLRIASETALMASEGTFEVGWWEGEAWRRFEGIYDYSADMGLLTVAIPEPSAFGLLAGLAALALAGTRRRKRR